MCRGEGEPESDLDTGNCAHQISQDYVIGYGQGSFTRLLDKPDFRRLRLPEMRES